ncbi:hypothetical protein LJC74_04200 [Eubacteriales bacterium OttesenSCG-928-A19]|nr:hypothetical protein [Eubacteriales bacterium OttesenSCG-928-A19]
MAAGRAFFEDFYRVEDEHVQLNLEMLHKVALNTICHFKNQTGSKRPFSKIMLNCLLDPFASYPSCKLDFRGLKE